MAIETQFPPEMLVGRAHLSTILRTPTGNISGAITTDWVPCGPYSLAVVRLDITAFTRPDTNEELDVFLQTTYNDRVDAVDLEQYHTVTAGAQTRLFVVTGPFSSATVRTETDGALGDNTKLDLPLGQYIRLKTAHTDPANADSVYALNAEVFLQS